MKEVPLARWDRQCLADLLALLETTPGSANFRSQLGDPNPHGTAYGGQLLAQTLMAASKSVPGGRSATAMQLFSRKGLFQIRRFITKPAHYRTASALHRAM